MKIKRIQFKHPELGIITVEAELNDFAKEHVNKMIETHEDKMYFLNFGKHFHGKIVKRNDGVFEIAPLKLVKEEIVHPKVIGMKDLPHKVILAIVETIYQKKIEIYPSGVLTVEYE